MPPIDLEMRSAEVPEPLTWDDLKDRVDHVLEGRNARIDSVHAEDYDTVEELAVTLRYEHGQDLPLLTVG